MSVSEISPEEIEVVVAAHALCGEGPVWDFRQSGLVWVDLWGKLFHSYDPKTGRDSTIDVGQPLGAVALRASGGFILALGGGFVFMDASLGGQEMFANVCRDDARL